MQSAVVLYSLPNGWGLLLDCRPPRSVLVQERNHPFVNDTQLSRNKYFFGFCVERIDHLPHPKESVSVVGRWIIVSQTQRCLNLVEPSARHVIPKLQRVPELISCFLNRKEIIIIVAWI